MGSNPTPSVAKVLNTATNPGSLALFAWCGNVHSTKHDANLVADILGDWREEVVFRRGDNRAPMAFTACIPTERKNPTLMHDPTCRMHVVVQNIGDNRTAEVGFCAAAGPPESAITIVRRAPNDRR